MSAPASLRLLYELGSGTALARAPAAETWRRAVGIRAAHKIPAITLLNFARGSGVTGYERELTSDAGSEAARQTQFRRFLDELSRDSPSGLRALVIKGQSLAQWYPRELVRVSSDIDLTVATATEFWKLSEWLLARGAKLLGIGGAARVGPGSQWRLLLGFGPSIGGPGHPTVEVQHGVFPVGRRLFLDFGDLPSFHVDPGIHYPTSTDALLILTAEVAGRDVIVRDAVDATMLLRDRRLEWRGLADRIRAYGLRAAFVRLMRFRSRLTDESVPPSVRASYSAWSRIDSVGLLAYAPWCATVPFALEAAGVPTALRELLLCAHRGIFRRLPGRLRRSSTVPYRHIDRRRDWVPLLHLGPTPAAPLQWASSPRGSALLRSPLGIFVAAGQTEFSREFVLRVREDIPPDWIDDTSES